MSSESQDKDGPPPDRPAAARRLPRGVWVLLLSVVLAAVGWLLLLPVASAPSYMGPLPWPVLLVMFVVAEVVVLHIQVRREAQTVSLSELPLVLALFFASPLVLVLTRVVGALVVLVVHRRSSPLKTLFNCCLVLAESALATSLFRLLAGGADGSLTPQPLTWLAAYVAVAAGAGVSLLALTAVISVYEGRPSPVELARDLGTSIVPPVMLTTMALVAVTSLASDFLSGWLLAAASVVLVFGYRAYAKLWDRHLSLERLFQFSEVVRSSPEVDEILRTVLEQARELLRSEHAQVTFLPSGARTAAVVASLHPNGRFSRREVSVDDADWLREAVIDQAETVLMPRGTTDPAMRSWLAAHELREAIVVPLRGEAGTLAMLAVGDRLGEVRAFDDDDVLLLETVSNQASLALQNGRLIGRLRHDALHDALTGLPNRVALQQRLTQELAEATGGRRTAVMILDLDGFKDVNDSLGHQQGDQLLVEVAARLVSAAGTDALVARLGGDEFAVVVPDAGHDEAVQLFARRLLRALEMPVGLDGIEMEVGGSIGVAVCPDHGTEPGALLRGADMAMYLAKDSSTGVQLFERQLSSVSTRRLVLVAELRHAVQEGLLAVHVQPKARLDDGRVTSVEALVRWQHPELGNVTPAEFIPVAERSGLIHALTQGVLDSALRECAAWRSTGCDVAVAVNLSTRSLLDDDITTVVQRALAAHRLPGEALILEITESSAMVERARAESLLAGLRDLGVRLSVDDFGTGYSSLSYLKRLPVSEVKIDKSFVSTLTRGGDDAAIVHSIIDLGHHLGLDVVAEGIEDAASWQQLREMGCHLGQGYHLARPMPAGDFAGWWHDYEDRRRTAGGVPAPRTAGPRPVAAAAPGTEPPAGRGLPQASEAPPAGRALPQASEAR